MSKATDATDQGKSPLNPLGGAEMGTLIMVPRRKKPLLTVPKSVWDRVRDLAPGKKCFATTVGAIPRLLLFPCDDQLGHELGECLEALRQDPIRWDEANESYADWPRLLGRIHTLSIWRGQGRVEIPKLLASLANLPCGEDEKEREVVVCNLGLRLIEVYSVENYRKEEERFRLMSKHELTTLEDEFRMQVGANS